MTPILLLWIGFALVILAINAWQIRKDPGGWRWWRDGLWSIGILALLAAILYPVHQNELGRAWRRNLVRDLAFSPDSRLLAIRRAGGITIREVATGRDLRTIKMGRLQSLFPTVYATEIARTGPRSMAFSADGSRLAVAGWGDTRLYDVRNGRASATWKSGPTPGPLVAQPDGKAFLAGDGGGGRVNMWTPQGGLIGSLQVCPPGYGPLDMALRADGRLVILTSSSLEVWDTSVGARQRSVPLGVEEHRIGPLYGWSLSSDGRWALLLSDGSGRGRFAYHLWDTVALRRVRTFELPTLGPVALSPDGRLVAGAGGINNLPAMSLWQTSTGRQIVRFPAEESPWCLAFSPDGEWLAAGSSEGVMLRPATLGPPSAS